MKAMRALKTSAHPGEWISTAQAHATTHLLNNDEGLAAVVCMRDPAGRTPVEVAGLLVHEAVHIWQEWCAYFGEKSPGLEQEAYAVQSLSQYLMAEYARRMNG